MTTATIASPAWRVADLEADTSWIFRLDERAQQDLAATVRAAYAPGKSLFDYTRDDFDLGAATPVLRAAFAEAKDGRGIALVKGLPREELTEQQFELLSWAIGLHTGVPRPQGKASHYISAVRNEGTDYRSSTGRGYSSNSELDFHVDGADIVTLACYNAAREGGQSMVTSSVTAHDQLQAERPDLAALMHRDFHFSRQAEQAPDEGPFYGQPIFDEAGGRLFTKWNRNRVQSAQKLEGVPPLSDAQREAMDKLDEILRRPELMFQMWLEPGDLQILNNHVMLHSRTNFVDFDEPERRRLLFRLWLAVPDSVALPDSWRHAYRSTAPGSVRGGILGQAHDAERQAFDRRQAETHGMKIAS